LARSGQVKGGFMKPRSSVVFIFLLLLAISGSQADQHDAYPLPEERGTAGTLAALEKLPVYGRLLQITAHPDDESAGTLTWLSRKLHAQTALFCLTRGEGGQNILGSEKYEALGLVRTGELLEACRYYGTELYFGKVVDFGFSKTAEETLSKWGYKATLEDLVRFIRRWRPAVVVSRFHGSQIDGHGHHQAAGMLAREAFQAAADPARFPDQLREGLARWQATKLYISFIGGVSLPGSPGREGGAEWTLRVPVGDYDPVLGRSYREIASEGYARHRTQGAGATFSPPARSFEYYKLVDSSVGIQPKEDSFFDAMDASLTAILDLVANERTKVPFLEGDLVAAKLAASEALNAFHASRPEKSAAAVAGGIDILTRLIRQIEGSSLSAPAKTLLNDALGTKRTDFQKALNAVLGIYLTATSEDDTGIPGDKEPVTVSFYNRGAESVNLDGIVLRAPGRVIPETTNPPFGEQPAGSAVTHRYSVTVPGEAGVTEPFWYLEASADARYKIRPTEDTFAAFGKPEILAEAKYRFRNTEVPVQATARAQAGDPMRGADFPEFQIVPGLSLTLEPQLRIAPVSAAAMTYEFRISVLNNRKGAAKGTLRLASDVGWRIQPAEIPFAMSRKGETFTASFTVQVPAGARSGDHAVEAIATLDGREFRRGYRTISYPGNWTRHLYRPAGSTIRIFRIKVAANLTAGYVPGAGDEIPAALEELGVKVHSLSAADLAFGNLSRFHVIVTGIRAYNVNEDLRANNRRLLDYVMQGGTLIVQYVRPMERSMRGSSGASFPFGPYPMSVSESDRITVEDSPVIMLDAAHPLLNLPNKISEADFQGWVQERGLYFMSSWDSRFKALLSGNDPGEEPKNGGMLYARYGKGHFIYTGYSWFRQLPAGIPGAFRILANMISLGQRPMNRR
jgi:LmbE family N-acetylglucosaminyl deacetylase